MVIINPFVAAEIPSITVSGVNDNETVGEGSIGEELPNVAGTSTEGTHQSEQTEDMLDGDDAVNKFSMLSFYIINMCSLHF